MIRLRSRNRGLRRCHPGRHLGDHRPHLRDPGQERRVRQRVGPVDSAGHDRDRGPVDRQGAAMRGGVDPERGARHDGPAAFGQPGTQAAGDGVSVAGAAARAHDRHRPLGQHREVGAAEHPQAQRRHGVVVQPDAATPGHPGRRRSRRAPGRRRAASPGPRRPGTGPPAYGTPRAPGRRRTAPAGGRRPLRARRPRPTRARRAGSAIRDQAARAPRSARVTPAGSENAWAVMRPPARPGGAGRARDRRRPRRDGPRREGRRASRPAGDTGRSRAWSAGLGRARCRPPR